jgi:hypothetical protein
MAAISGVIRASAISAMFAGVTTNMAEIGLWGMTGRAYLCRFIRRTKSCESRGAGWRGDCAGEGGLGGRCGDGNKLIELRDPQCFAPRHNHVMNKMKFVVLPVEWWKEGLNMTPCTLDGINALHPSRN